MEKPNKDKPLKCRDLV